MAAVKGRLSESERIQMLGLVDAIASRPPSRPLAAVHDEIEGLRAARRRGGRRSRRRRAPD